MDQLVTRNLTGQLADDLGWLEEHCRSHPEQAVHAGELRFAAALVRNCVGPYLDGQAARPLHVAVVGGAGAGKSTVANLLSGTPTAESNPQAGFTRHPIAYTSADGVAGWTGHVGFLGRLQRLTQPSPSNLDADVYQVRTAPAQPGVPNVLQNFVVWDCPDMTTWAAAGYVPRLLEVAAVADVIVYVASDERYNDEVPTQFLRLLIESGKPVVVCLMKMKDADVSALQNHFRQEVLSRMPGGAVACLAIPHLSAEELAEPSRVPAKYRIPLLNQVAVLGEPPDACRRRNVRAAANYLLCSQEKLLGVARHDVAALQQWRDVVQVGQVEFDNRYRREYLTSEKFRRFDEALVRLLELLELPGVGRTVSNVLWAVRAPYRLLKGFFTKTLGRPEARNMPELPVLEGALAGWLDLLHKEAAHRAKGHPLWAHVEQGFASGALPELARERFQQGFRGFQLGIADEVERTARAIYEDLEQKPAVLNTLRGGKFVMDVGAILAAVVTGGHNWPLDFLLVPLAAAITQQLVEMLGAQYVDNQRERARQRQQALVVQYVSGPLAEWLAQWPTTGGSSYERLHLALRRIPTALKQLDAAVSHGLEGAHR
jgi:hypothetical protein